MLFSSGSLGVASVALVYLATVQCAARGVVTFRTHKALWTTQTVECLLALLLTAVLFEKRLRTDIPFGNRTAFLVMTAFSLFSDSSVIQGPVAQWLSHWGNQENL